MPTDVNHLGRQGSGDREVLQVFEIPEGVLKGGLECEADFSFFGVGNLGINRREVCFVGDLAEAHNAREDEAKVFRRRGLGIAEVALRLGFLTGNALLTSQSCESLRNEDSAVVKLARAKVREVLVQDGDAIGQKVVLVLGIVESWTGKGDGPRDGVGLSPRSEGQREA